MKDSYLRLRSGQRDGGRQEGGGRGNVRDFVRRPARKPFGYEVCIPRDSLESVGQNHKRIGEYAALKLGSTHKMVRKQADERVAQPTQCREQGSEASQIRTIWA